MSILSYFAKHSFVRLAGYVLSVVCAFVITPRMLRSMGSDVYGVWALISSASAYYLLLGFGLTQSVSNRIAQADARNDTKKAGRIFTAAMAIGTAACLLVLLIAAVINRMAEPLSGGIVGAGAFTASFLSFSAAVGVQLLLRSAYGVLTGRMRWRAVALIGMARTLLSSAAVLLFVSEARPPEANLLAVAAITSGSFVFESCAHLFLASRSIRIRFSLGRAAFPWTAAVDLLRFGASIIALQIGEILRGRVQIYLVGLLLSVQQVAFFSLARQFINYMNDIIMSVFGIMNPYFSSLHTKGDTGECNRSLLISLMLSYSTASVVSLGLAFYGGLFVERWIGPEYRQIHAVLTPMALAGLFSAGDMPASGFLMGIGKQAFLARFSILEGLFNTLASIPALVYCGLPGVGWTFFLGAVLFRVLVLPRSVCAISGIAPATYYANMALALGPAVIAQCAYHALIAARLKPEYLVLLGAGAGQFLVASLTLLGVARLRNRRAQCPQPAIPAQKRTGE